MSFSQTEVSQSEALNLWQPDKGVYFCASDSDSVCSVTELSLERGQHKTVSFENSFLSL